MKFGSVNFFRRLILLITLLLIITLTIGICFTGYGLNKAERKIMALENKIQQMSIQGEAQETVSQESEPLYYQTMYQNLYAEQATEYNVAENTIYLTFDDGPTKVTEKILDILKENNVKATFFVMNNKGQESILKRIVDEGHAIGIHTYSHSYTDIYDSVEAFLDDFNAQYEMISKITGVKPDIFRFPGGTINKYNTIIRKELTAEMNRRGFTYYDWNATAADMKSSVSAEEVLQNSIDTGAGKSRIIMLLHDGESKGVTAEALPSIISYYKDKGYNFGILTNDVKPIAFD